MASQPESSLSRKIMAQLRLRGYFVFKVWGNEHTMAGLPDLITCAEGYFIGLEVKMPAKRKNVSAIQLHRQGQILEAGGQSFVVCSAAEALEVIDQFLKSKK